MEPRDRVSETLIEALTQAVAAGQEQRLYRAGKLDGLFPGRTAVSTEAAHRALSQGLLEQTRLEVKGKSEIEWVRITPRGVQFLHDTESPLRALHDLRAAVQSSRRGLPAWVDEAAAVLAEVKERLQADADRWHARLEALERRVGDALRRLEATGPLVPPDLARDHPWAIDALNYLDRRRSAGAPGQCPLPELFAAVVEHHPALPVGAFHEGLRRLNERRALTLRPATSPDEMTGPEYALWDGTSIHYYAVR